MIQIIKKLRVLLDKKQKRTMVGLIILMVISAFLQTAGVGMLVEVMQIVIDPEAVQHSRVAEACYEIMGVESYRTFSIIVMVLLILVFVVKNLFTYVQQKLTLSFVYTNQFRTSERMMRNYLRRGYEFYLNADTAVVQRSIRCQQYVCTDPGTVTAVIRQRGFPVCHQLLLYFQRYHDDPDGGGIASVDVADQESAEAHHVQGR